MPKNSNLYRFGLLGALANIAAGGLAYWIWSGSGKDDAVDPAERLALAILTSERARISDTRVKKLVLTGAKWKALPRSC